MRSNTFLKRVIGVLRCFTPEDGELTAVDICHRSGLPQATTYRLLTSLVDTGFLEWNRNTGKYKIGIELHILGNLYSDSTELSRVAQPVIRLLNELTNEVVAVAVIEESRHIVIMREESRHSLRFGVRVGSSFPAYAPASGKALLSELSVAEIDKLFPDETLRQLTPKTIATKSQLKIQLEHIRKTGFALNREETFLGVESIGVVIRDQLGKGVAALTIGVPTARMDDTKREQLITLTKMGANVISYRLGYSSNGHLVTDIEEIRSWWRQHPAHVVISEPSFQSLSKRPSKKRKPVSG